ncbi:leucine-rich repeat-containing protein 20 [Anguilla anguilla]|uniref:leucine-rich repeat-containing protein 20 n=1 Tax=Anguilla anguilla TaxID=7936 RepID=UPI0015AE377A|nr:leucine-rich repeat-containing protein 20 [Anguilla anguilla]XP_035259099.1 leucine-rich repeat-containing protein 20 [Anguilla anguilla]XP_035259100.1 leucine-rich repeat-containing protein 20 [Anguilla anguilla]XP_035259101.1 leucine-rich repeat-containing protein 20 [Anguilla anguilla]
MAEAVANVARRINETAEEGKDTLDLSNCKLISFPEGVFKVLRSVTEKIHVITLANNEMKAITSKFFTTFTQLRELDLEGNALSKLPDAAGELQHLRSINLARNKFSTFPESLAEIHTLEKINLEGNGITEIPVEKLSAMPALMSVNMNSNPVDKDVLASLHPSIKFEILTTKEI